MLERGADLVRRHQSPIVIHEGDERGPSAIRIKIGEHVRRPVTLSAASWKGLPKVLGVLQTKHGSASNERSRQGLYPLSRSQAVIPQAWPQDVKMRFRLDVSVTGGYMVRGLVSATKVCALHCDKRLRQKTEAGTEAIAAVLCCCRRLIAIAVIGWAALRKSAKKEQCRGHDVVLAIIQHYVSRSRMS